MHSHTIFLDFGGAWLELLARDYSAGMRLPSNLIQTTEGCQLC